MKRNIIRLTEGDLHKIIMNTVRKALNESGRIMDTHDKYQTSHNIAEKLGDLLAYEADKSLPYDDVMELIKYIDEHEDDFDIFTSVEESYDDIEGRTFHDLDYDDSSKESAKESILNSPISNEEVKEYACNLIDEIVDSLSDEDFIHDGMIKYGGD